MNNITQDPEYPGQTVRPTMSIRETHVYPASVSDEGSCNGCQCRDDDLVYVVSLRSCSVRLCRDCARDVVAGLNLLAGEPRCQHESSPDDGARPVGEHTGVPAAYSERTNMNTTNDGWGQYKRKGVSEMRPYVPGEDMAGISVSAADKENGSPKPGDMIAPAVQPYSRSSRRIRIRFRYDGSEWWEHKVCPAIPEA